MAAPTEQVPGFLELGCPPGLSFHPGGFTAAVNGIPTVFPLPSSSYLRREGCG